MAQTQSLGCITATYAAKPVIVPVAWRVKWWAFITRFWSSALLHNMVYSEILIMSDMIREVTLHDMLGGQGFVLLGVIRGVHLHGMLGGGASGYMIRGLPLHDTICGITLP